MSDSTVYDPSTEKPVTHYHGDHVRLLFMSAAVLLFLTNITGAELPFSTGGSIVIIVILVIAAGITNPAQMWIHWFNITLSALGVMLFGGISLASLHNGFAIFSNTGFVALLAINFLVALYFSTRTLRGLMVPVVHPDESGEF